MAIITTGQTFNPTSVVTSTKLEDIANKATFVAEAVDGTSLELISGGTDNGKLGIKDAGITTDKVADSTDKTDGVTLPKIQFIDTAKVLGRTTAGEGNVEELDFKTETDMASDSDTAVASQKSIKAYADTVPKAQMKVNNVAGATYAGEESITFPNGLIMKLSLIHI